NRVEICALDISGRWTVAADSPPVAKTSKAPVTTVTMDTKPKSFGSRRWASATSETRRTSALAAWPISLAAPPRIVLSFRSFRSQLQDAFGVIRPPLPVEAVPSQGAIAPSGGPQSETMPADSLHAPKASLAAGRALTQSARQTAH